MAPLLDFAANLKARIAKFLILFLKTTDIVVAMCYTIATCSSFSVSAL